MAVKYYSDKLNKVFNTEQECLEAEFKAKEKENLEKIRKEKEARELKEKKEKEVAERKADAEKVEAARTAMVEAQKKFHEALEEFCKAHGPYHYTLTGVDALPRLLDFVSDWF